MITLPPKLLVISSPLHAHAHIFQLAYKRYIKNLLNAEVHTTQEIEHTG